jgi:hypothetical protein
MMEHKYGIKQVGLCKTEACPAEYVEISMFCFGKSGLMYCPTCKAHYNIPLDEANSVIDKAQAEKRLSFPGLEWMKGFACPVSNEQQPSSQMPSGISQTPSESIISAG